jgi:hypothetical protein
MAKATEQARVAARGAATAGEADASAETAAEGLCLPMFSMTPHRGEEVRWARLTQIDPIQVWINAERRLMGLVRS